MGLSRQNSRRKHCRDTKGGKDDRNLAHGFLHKKTLSLEYGIVAYHIPNEFDFLSERCQGAMSAGILRRKDASGAIRHVRSQ
jgi:hypothetical protein